MARRGTKRGIAAAVLLAGLGGASTGCGNGNGQSTSCTNLPSDAGAVPTRAVQVGDGQSATFAPYADGGDTSILLGPQGGYMITPDIQVAGAAGDADAPCLLVQITNTMDGVDVTPGLISLTQFSQRGTDFYSPALFDLLSYTRADIAGHTLTLAVSVLGDTYQGSATVHLKLQ